MYHVFVDGVGRFVGEYAGGEARYKFLNIRIESAFHDVLIHIDIVVPKIHRVFQVAIQAAHKCREVQDMGWFMFFKYLLTC